MSFHPSGRKPKTKPIEVPLGLLPRLLIGVIGAHLVLLGFWASRQGHFMWAGRSGQPVYATGVVVVGVMIVGIAVVWPGLDGFAKRLIRPTVSHKVKRTR